MNWKRFFPAALAAYIVLQLLALIIHGKILDGVYQPLMEKGIFRSEAEMSGYMWVELLMTAFFALLFTYIFVKGREGRGIMEGVRFGIIVGFFWSYINAYDTFVIFPIPYALVWYWIIAGFVQTILAGVAVSMIYKPKGS
jgi:hypothetical protein